MTDFEPQTDFPEMIEADETPFGSTSRARDLAVQKTRRRLLWVFVLAATLILLAFGQPWPRVLSAMAGMYLILEMGFAVIGAFARPVPEAPPPGELRRVKLTYRCSTCGTEIRMTRANDQMPEAPRHCADEMELTTPTEDL